MTPTRPDAVRVVVTGLDSDGAPDFVHDFGVEATPSSPGNAVNRLWAFDDIPMVPAVVSIESFDPIFPVVGGVRFALVTYGPGEHGNAADARDRTDMPDELRRVIPLDRHGMHNTATVDMGYVVAGELTLELPGGRERILRRGDAYVQHGVEHAWRNRGDTPCEMVVVLIGAPSTAEQ